MIDIRLVKNKKVKVNYLYILLQSLFVLALNK